MEDESELGKNLTFKNGLFTLCKATIGISLISISAAFSIFGLILGTIMVLFIGIVNIYSLKALVLSGKKSNCKSYTELGEKIAGRTGKYIATSLLFLCCMMTLVFYVDVSSIIYKDFFEANDIFIGKNITIITTTFISTILAIILSNPKNFLFSNILGLGCSIAFVVYVVWMYFDNLNNIEYENIMKIKINAKILEKLSIVSFAFCSQFGIFDIANNIRNKKNTEKIINIANIMGIIAYTITGICGSISNPNCGDTFFDVEMIKKGGLLIKILCFALATINICAYPIIMNATKLSIDLITLKAVNSRLLKRFSLTNKNGIDVVIIILISTIVCSITIWIEGDLIYISNFFSIIGSIVMFALPSFFYLKIHGRKSKKLFIFFAFINTILTIIGIFFGIKGLFFT